MPNISIPRTHIILAPNPAAADNHIARHSHSFSNPEGLWFFCYGNQPTQHQISSMLASVHKKKIILLYEDDLLGRVAAIKIACWIKGRDVQLKYERPEMILIRFNGHQHYFPEHQLSLSRFEKRTGLRTQIKTYKILSNSSTQ